MRSQLPMLVASLQGSISTARLGAAVAAASSASSLGMPPAPGGGGGRPAHGAASAPASPAAAPEAAHKSVGLGIGLGDLDDLELLCQLGLGANALVFRGRLGTQDCAIKLMEMPNVDRTSIDASGAAGIASPPGSVAGCPASAAAAAAAVTAAAAAGAGKQLAAQRALLRNAMELAAMQSISHPNVMQVYSTFSPVIMAASQTSNGRRTVVLKPAGGAAAAETAPGGSPVCLAIVCERCDRGCLGTALASKAFVRKAHLAPPSAAVTPLAGSHTAAAAAAAAGGRRDVRALDMRAILMTLMDVAMALRHIHSHHLIHRDLKPANVLLKTSTTDPRGFTVKLADFGFVTLLNQPGDESNGSSHGRTWTSAAAR